VRSASPIGKWAIWAELNVWANPAEADGSFYLRSSVRLAGMTHCGAAKAPKSKQAAKVGRLTSMPPIKTSSTRSIELERLRRELLRRIVQNEAQRRATHTAAAK
jgi:hypothetical protein